MNKHDVTVSKFLALVLRHQPEAIGLALDGEGWADVDELIAKAAARGRVFNRATLARVVADNDKKRYALSEDGTRIRAVQGHSTATVALAHAEHEPPDVLYHGTATRFLDSILAQGLIPGTRHHVHLSADEETAVKVGQRHGKPVVLAIAATRMRTEGHVFYRSENGVWLVAAVPVAYLGLLQC